MHDFTIYFRDCPPLFFQIDLTYLGQRYLHLLKQQVQDDPRPIFRDPQKYTMEHFQGLVARAQEVLGWDWCKGHYTLEVTTRLHKDIETYLARGYENIPEAHDEILHELHFCLHAIESGSQRSSWLQIEWYNDRGFKISAEEYPKKIKLEFGDLRLQNPYVGHHPLYLYEQRDSINVLQTCRFHDRVKPGINIVISSGGYSLDRDRYLDWWRTNAPEFLSRHSEKELLDWTGHPIIGRVLNLKDLETVVARPVLEFSHIEI